jgi:CelD/BcsL family acetyltransferase involved in cellulose biosynthesis
VITVDVVRTPEDVRYLSSEWDALCDVADGATPFQRPAWTVAWLAHFGAEPPVVLAVRSGRDLVGLLPAFVREAGGVRTLSLLGAGPSDHLDALAAPGHAQATLDAVHEWLHAARLEWSACAFDEIGPRALLRELRSPAGTRATIQPQSVCPVLVSQGEAEVERVVPRAQLGRLRKAHQRARTVGRVEVERADGDVDGAMRGLLALQAKRWELCSEAGTLGDARARRMHADVARAFAARGALRVYRLSIGGRTAAVVVGLREGTRVCLYLQGSDPSLERASPGMLVVGFAIADALAEGAGEVDFLRGGDAYKYAWGAMDEANARVCIA